MRIGLVCPYSFSHPGGVQNHVLGLAGWLAAQGHHVEVLGPGTPTVLPWGVRFTGAGPGVPVTYNGSVARVNFGAGPWLRVRRWLAAGRFDVVHLHEPITPSVSMLALWLTKAPVVATFHTATPGSRSMRLAEQVLPGSIKRIDAAIAVSEVAREVAASHIGVPAVVIGNGISFCDYAGAPTTTRWRAGDHPRITFLGRYSEPRKGFGVLLAALPAVRAEIPGVEVDVIGSGLPLLGQGDVRVLAGLSDAERNALLAASDVYVAPHTGRESFGIVLLEALASGAPVVASDLPAFRQVISDDDGPVGHLVVPGDAAALSRALVRSLREPRDLRLERGRAVAVHYDWSVIGPMVASQYQQVSRAPAE